MCQKWVHIPLVKITHIFVFYFCNDPTQGRENFRKRGESWKFGENIILLKINLAKFTRSLKKDCVLYPVISLLGYYPKEVVKNAERFMHRLTVKNHDWTLVTSTKMRVSGILNRHRLPHRRKREEKNRNKNVESWKANNLAGPKERNPKLAAKNTENHHNLHPKISQRVEELVALGPSGREGGGWNKGKS